MTGGTYTLVLERSRSGPIAVGALGERQFPAGWYAYTGSALGAGGFSRIDRHRAVDRGENDTRHWHVDYLLGDEATRIETVWTTAADVECAVARGVLDVAGVAGIDDFGCSDCDCRSHLAYHADRETLLECVDASHDDSGGGA
jgi:endonuclease-3